MSIIHRACWLLMEDYELREDKNGLCVCPARGAAEHTYNPFEQSDFILFDILHIGWLESRGELSPELILTFVRQYGMLGFLTSVIQKEYDDGSVKLRPTNFVTQRKTFTVQEYFSTFLPRIDNYVKYSGTNEKMPVSMLMTRRQPERQWNVLERDDYSEKVSWITAFSLYLYGLAEKAQRGDAIHYELGNVVGGLTSEEGIRPKITWRFDSLKSAIDIMLMTEFTSERRTLKLCKHCGLVFRISNPKAEYCSASCRNTANVKQSRKRKRETQNQRS